MTDTTNAALPRGADAVGHLPTGGHAAAFQMDQYMTHEQDPIAHACRLLRDAAYDLLVNHTPHRARGDWTGEEDAKESYDEHIAAADALERWAAGIGAGGVGLLRKGSHQIAASGATFLFEHEDGRYAINPDTTGDPAWHRLGPVDISGIAPVQDAPPAAVAELVYAEVVQAIEGGGNKWSVTVVKEPTND